MQSDKLSPGFVSEEFLNLKQESAKQTGRLLLLSRTSLLFSAILDSFSFLFFCLSFSSLAHLFSSWCSRFIAEE
jgi:hypothetical protein